MLSSHFFYAARPSVERHKYVPREALSRGARIELDFVGFDTCPVRCSPREVRIVPRSVPHEAPPEPCRAPIGGKGLMGLKF